jgi:hypothetical protein
VLAGPGLTDGGKCIVRVLVTSTGTVFQFADGVEDFRRINFLVRIGLELGRVAARAIRLICRELPCDYFVISLVARRAGKPVVSLVSRRHVSVRRGRRPRSGTVARVTRPGRNEVCGGFARCRGTVVTGGACTGRDTRVAKCRRLPCCRAMAYVAALRRRNMVCRFARRGCAVVTGRTCARRYTGMAKRCRFPGSCTVARIAGLGRRKMGRWFA